MRNTKKGFNYSISALLLFVIAFIMWLLNINFDLEFLNVPIGLTLMISILLSFIGTIYLLIGIREGKSKKRIIGFIINGLYLMLIVFAIIRNTRAIETCC
jgi:uncharacterized membrane protein